MAETDAQHADAGLGIQDFLGEVDEFEDPGVVVERIVFCKRQNKSVSMGFLIFDFGKILCFCFAFFFFFFTRNPPILLFIQTRHSI